MSCESPTDMALKASQPSSSSDKQDCLGSVRLQVSECKSGLDLSWQSKLEFRSEEGEEYFLSKTLEVKYWSLPFLTPTEV